MLYRFLQGLSLIFACAGLIALSATASFGDDQQSDDPAEEPSPLQYVAPKTYDMKVGLRLSTGNGAMAGTKATTVFPTDWPEQKVEIIAPPTAPSFQTDFRELPGGNRQLLMFARTFPANSTQEVAVTVRITKSHTVGPEDTTNLVIPRRVSRDMRQFLGDSPYIKSTGSDVRRIVREIDEAEFDSDWQRIEAYYDWVRENIEYVNGELKTTQQALKDRQGDCEEMTSIFIALCRASRIPARCVWIPNHCYPEFYMEDKEGNGYWFPCQAAGTRNFGSMPEYLPILQKGDRFQVPEKKERQRYIADYLSAKHVSGSDDPKVEFLRELLGDAANMKSPDLDGAAQP